MAKKEGGSEMAVESIGSDVDGAQAHRVKTALSSGKVTASTVYTIKALLGVTDTTTPHSKGLTGSDKRVTAPTIQNVQKSRGKSVKADGLQCLKVHEDSPKQQIQRARRKFATEIVNSSLKILTEAVRSRRKAPSGSLRTDGRSLTSSHAIRHRHQQPLKQISGNATSSPAKDESPKHNVISSSSAEKAEDISPHVLATAECSQVAFAYLRTMHRNKAQSDKFSIQQLLQGMLILSDSLLDLGMDTLAVRELRAAKHKMESEFPHMNRESRPPASRNAEVKTAKETLASLLQFCAAPPTEILSLAIHHQTLVIKAISAANRPATIEAAASHLTTNVPQSISDLINARLACCSDGPKAASQLESLSSLLLSLCPGVNSTNDVTAIDPTRSIGPRTAFGLQVKALTLRKQCWPLTSHTANERAELVEPFTRCLKAFVRRSTNVMEPSLIHQTAVSNYLALFGNTTLLEDQAAFDMHNILCNTAETAGKAEDAKTWCRRMEENCMDLVDGNARKVSVCLRQLRLGMIHINDIEQLSMTLGRRLTGQVADHESLLVEMSYLVPSLIDGQGSDMTSASIEKFVHLSAGFALRFFHSYPGRNNERARRIVQAASRLKATSEVSRTWLTSDAITLLAESEVLHSVISAAKCRSWEHAWESSKDAVILGHALHRLVLKILDQNPDAGQQATLTFPEFPKNERGTLIEWQLRYALKYTSKPRYKATLQKLLPDMFQLLALSYPADIHPIRHAIVAVLAMRLHDMHPDIFPSSELHSWREASFNVSDLREDTGLGPYAQDIHTLLKITRCMSDHDFSWEQLKGSLLAWQEILGICGNRNALLERVYDATSFVKQLESTASYLAATGQEDQRFLVLEMLVKANALLDQGSSGHVSALVELADHLTTTGFPHQAEAALSQASESANQKNCDIVTRMRFHIATAEYLFTEGDALACEGALQKARGLGLTLPPSKVSRSQRTSYEIIHARKWLVRSKLYQDSNPHEAFASARDAVKVINGVWNRLERDSDPSSKSQKEVDMTDGEETSLNTISNKVSKLRLTPVTDAASDSAVQRKGALFWPVVSIACTALMHLSNVYTHHGMFTEASFYSERAVSIATTIPSSSWASRTRSHRVLLLGLADRCADAELCLAANEESCQVPSWICAVEDLKARATLRAYEGDFLQATILIQEGESILARTVLETKVKHCEPSRKESGELAILSSSRDTHDQRPKVRGTAAKTRETPGSKASSGVPKERSSTANVNEPRQTCTKISQLETDLRLQKATMLCASGAADTHMPELLTATFKSTSAISSQRKLQFTQSMRDISRKLQTDVTYNSLLESALSYPALCGNEKLGAAASASTTLRSSSSMTSKRAKTAKKIKQPGDTKKTPDMDFGTLLREAHDRLLDNFMSAAERCTVAEAHAESGMLLKATLLSSCFASQTSTILHAGCAMDYSRIRASTSQQMAICVESKQKDGLELYEWPTLTTPQHGHQLDAENFQEQYVDILPRSWTAVSLCLNEDGSELYAARYRSGKSPFVVRLPFSRHEEDECEEGAFDYETGKAELRDIIEQSNKSCHNGADMSVRGAKSNWWQERELLDRRLHELLINIESIWFGGLKSVFSPHSRSAPSLEQFKDAFMSILDRYLPSRKRSKDGTTKLSPGPDVLELFVNLGSDQDGAIDLEEPVTDLLYFVLDILRFNGEQNAYDEIDLDSMTIEVLEALRDYHDTLDEDITDNEHLILVLDRRLQAFPWESLPYMQNMNVSRVGSMLSLREGILAMERNDRANAKSNANQYCVDQRTGMVVLNPESDLKGTQAMIEPALSHLKANAKDWNLIANRRPSEEEIKSGLTNTAITLYFGHGSGSQYIRTRSIKKLEKCSEVVWLMGCSSGAVTEYGELEPSAVPLSYLMAGSSSQQIDAAPNDQKQGGKKCLAVLANLWDVTDKDIDRFSIAVGEEWNLWPAAAGSSKMPVKAPKRGERNVAPTTPQKVPKTPRTPKVNKTPGMSKTPARGSGRQGSQETKEPQSLSQAVSTSRDACYLRYLNGAAPVVFGLPVYLGV